MQISAEKHIICVICYDETNSGVCLCDHRGMTIVVDLGSDIDPCKAAEIRFKTLGNVTVGNVSMEQCKMLFDLLCSKAKEVHKDI